MITTCTIQDLRNMGEDYTGSVVAAKRFIRRRCPHQTAIKGIDCMKEIIGPTNEFRYCVASQNQDLNKQLLDIPAIPLLTLSRDTLLLSPLSAASQAKINKAASIKLLPSADELKRLKAVTGLDLEALKEPQLPLHKRKKAKGPNPLSVKKKKPEPKLQKIPSRQKTEQFPARSRSKCTKSYS
ncbi:hypothetical protein DSO57_1034149 [Entomophthora muscae]|uniref:Uncharacterized protein n=2 Tax=Entomophthora muscae TaxID=34485 RepID=A0ACC2TB90_9FUNG|nr:hypothetical protein DSO57_1034149 [Entomophthora muscae]